MKLMPKVSIIICAVMLTPEALVFYKFNRQIMQIIKKLYSKPQWGF